MDLIYVHKSMCVFAGWALASFQARAWSGGFSVCREGDGDPRQRRAMNFLMVEGKLVPVLRKQMAVDVTLLCLIPIDMFRRVT